VGFKTTISTGERAQIYTFERAATSIRFKTVPLQNNIKEFSSYFSINTLHVNYKYHSVEQA